MEDGGSVKALHRRIMLSAAYQMSSDITKEAAEQEAHGDMDAALDRARKILAAKKSPAK